MRQRTILFAWLLGLWLLLWRDVSFANVASGVAVSAVAALGLQLHQPTSTARAHGFRPLALARFAVYFSVKLVEANLVLAREVLTPTNDIHTGIIGVSLPPTTDFVTTVIANAVSLTPGTLTLEVRWAGAEPTLYVHVLHLHDLDAARAEVLQMARYAMAAFPSSTAGQGVDA